MTHGIWKSIKRGDNKQMSQMVGPGGQEEKYLRNIQREVNKQRGKKK